jgi:hypothetical protein
MAGIQQFVEGFLTRIADESKRHPQGPAAAEAHIIKLELTRPKNGRSSTQGTPAIQVRLLDLHQFTRPRFV